MWIINLVDIRTFAIIMIKTTEKSHFVIIQAFLSSTMIANRVEFFLPCWALWWFGQTASGKLESKILEGGGKKWKHWQDDRERWNQFIPVNTLAVRWHFPSCWNAEDCFVIPLIGCDYIITGREWSHSLAAADRDACSTTNYLLLN